MRRNKARCFKLRTSSHNSRTSLMSAGENNYELLNIELRKRETPTKILAFLKPKVSLFTRPVFRNCNSLKTAYLICKFVRWKSFPMRAEMPLNADYVPTQLTSICISTNKVRFFLPARKNNPTLNANFVVTNRPYPLPAYLLGSLRVRSSARCVFVKFDTVVPGEFCLFWSFVN